MGESSNRPSGCTSIGLISLIASALGSILAALIYSATFTGSTTNSETSGFGGFLFVALFVFYFGVFIALAIGLILGMPLLAVSRRYIIGHLTVAAVAFATIGLVGSLVLIYLDGNNDLGNAPFIFGACVGGMHPLIYARMNGARWLKIISASLISAVSVPTLAYAGEDLINYLESQSEFEKLCEDYYGSMAVKADSAALEQSGDRKRFTGKWLNQLKWRSLYQREDWAPFDEAHTLIARDYALVTEGFVGWISSGRRVVRHCLSEKKGSEANMLRSHGFGKRPTLQDLSD